MAPNIPSRPTQIVEELKKFLSDTEVTDLNHPDPISYGANIKIAYPVFLHWLHFTDEIRNHGDLREKVLRYRHIKPRYENSISHRLDQYKQRLSGKAVMNQIDRANHSISIVPAAWNKTLTASTHPDDPAAAAPKGELVRQLDSPPDEPVTPLNRGTGRGTDATITISPENIEPLAKLSGNFEWAAR